MQTSEKPLLYRTLKVLLSKPIVIGMWGDWESGKTDASLLMGYLALKWGLVDKVATNIETKPNKDPLANPEYIYQMSKLKGWMYRDRSIKLYILDECLKHLYRRKAMSQKNVEVITEILPELGHGNARLIAISQIAKLDSDLIHPAFMRAEFKKLKQKLMIARSRHWKGTRTFENLPRSPTRFSRGVPSKFVIDKSTAKMFNSQQARRLYEVATRYDKGHSYRQIGVELDMDRQEVKRDVKKICRWFSENFDGKLGKSSGSR